MKTPQDKARAYFEKKFPKEKNTDRWNWAIRFAADFHTEMMVEEREGIFKEELEKRKPRIEEVLNKSFGESMSDETKIKFFKWIMNYLIKNKLNQ